MERDKMENKIEPETTQNELVSKIEKLHELESCKHCTHNEKAQKPFSDMKNIELTPLAEKAIEETAKKYGVKEESCLVCLSIQGIIS